MRGPLKRWSLIVPAAAVLALGGGRTAGHAQVSPQPAAGAPDSARTALARQLLVRMRMPEALLLGIEQGIESQKKEDASVPEIYVTTFVARAKEQIPALLDRLAPIYASRFSSAELQQLLAFYDTPVGRHLAEQSAAIDTDSMKAAQLWGVGVAGDLMKELAAKGVVPE
jgi:hypothetical protein